MGCAVEASIKVIMAWTGGQLAITIRRRLVRISVGVAGCELLHLISWRF